MMERLKSLSGTLFRHNARRHAQFCRVSRDVWAGFAALSALTAAVCLFVAAVENHKMHYWSKRS